MVPIHKLETWMPVFPKKQYSILGSLLLYVPNPDKPELNIESGYGTNRLQTYISISLMYQQKIWRIRQHQLSLIG